MPRVGDRSHRRTGVRGQLDDGTSDRTARAVDENGLDRSDPGELDGRLPGGQPGQGHQRGTGKRDIARSGDWSPLGRPAPALLRLGESPTIHHSERGVRGTVRAQQIHPNPVLRCSTAHAQSRVNEAVVTATMGEVGSMLQQRRTGSGHSLAGLGSHVAEGPPFDPSAGQDRLENLLHLVGEGDVAAFEVLYAQVWGVVYGMAVGVLRDTHQGEEVAQEVLLEIWRTAARFDVSRGHARSWIVTMTRRRSIDRVRSSQASRIRDAAVAASQSVRDYDDVLEQVQTRLEIEHLRRCLQHLSARQRDTLTLAFYDGHSYAQVATLLNLPLGTVKTRIRDGLTRLRDCPDCSRAYRRKAASSGRVAITGAAGL